MIAPADRDLPDPDSPTMQTISPGFTVRFSPSSAKGRSEPSGRAIFRSRISRIGD